MIATEHFFDAQSNPIESGIVSQPGDNRIHVVVKTTPDELRAIADVMEEAKWEGETPGSVIIPLTPLHPVPDTDKEVAVHLAWQPIKGEQ